MTTLRFRAEPDSANNLRVRVYTSDRLTLLATVTAGITEQIVGSGSYQCDVGSISGSWYVLVNFIDTGEITADGFASSSSPEVIDCLPEATVTDPSEPTIPDAVSAESIAASGAGPLSISVDGLTITQRPISDQIAADRHSAANAGASPSKGFGLRFARVKPGSAVGE